MKKIIFAGMLLLVLTLIFIGCTFTPPETTMQPSPEQPIVQTEQQILKEYPDNLDQALEELELVEEFTDTAS